MTASAIPSHRQAMRDARVKNVEEARHQETIARNHLTQMIREARAEGVPLRVIARAAKLSHESVRKIAGEA